MDNAGYLFPGNCPQPRNSVIVHKAKESQQQQGGHWPSQGPPSGGGQGGRSPLLWSQTYQRRNEDRLTYSSYSTTFLPSSTSTDWESSGRKAAQTEPSTKYPPPSSHSSTLSVADSDVLQSSSSSAEDSTYLDFERRLAQPSSFLQKFSSRESVLIEPPPNTRTVQEMRFDIDDIFSQFSHLAGQTSHTTGPEEVTELSEVEEDVDQIILSPLEPQSRSSSSSTDLPEINSKTSSTSRGSRSASDQTEIVDQRLEYDYTSFQQKDYSSFQHKDENPNGDAPVEQAMNNQSEPKETEAKYCSSEDGAALVGRDTKRPTSDCTVCGDRAIAHMHYGGICCYSCKAFFRRAVQSCKEYRCKKGENCEVTVKSRRLCQKCRFDKCGKIGMKASWVLSDEQCEIRFGRGKKRELSGGGLEEERVDEGPSPEKRTLSGEDELAVEYMMCLYEASKEMISFSEENSFLMGGIFDKKLKHEYSSSEMNRLVLTVIKKNIFILEANSFFKTLSVKDQRMLLSKNMTEMCHLRGALRYNVGSKSFQWYFSSRDKVATSNNEGGVSNAVIKEDDIKNFYGSNVTASYVMHTIERIASMGLATEAILLLMHVVIFSADGLDLDRNTFVQDTQAHYLAMLQSHVMAMLVDLRECSEISSSQKLNSNFVSN